MLRACGIPFDLRRADPYSVYDELDFEIPIGSTGDCFDRFLVSMKKYGKARALLGKQQIKFPKDHS